jgi:hypothetical protein
MSTEFPAANESDYPDDEIHLQGYKYNNRPNNSESEIYRGQHRHTAILESNGGIKRV